MADELKKWDYRVQNFGSVWTGAKPEDIEAAQIARQPLRQFKQHV